MLRNSGRFTPEWMAEIRSESVAGMERNTHVSFGWRRRNPESRKGSRPLLSAKRLLSHHKGFDKID